MSELVAGVELGGTKCIAILGRAPGDIVAREQVATGDPKETLTRLGAILERWQDEQQFEALGIASFGPLELDEHSSGFGTLKQTPKPGWAGADVFGSLKAAARVPAAIDTDVNGAALAEMRWGVGQDLDDFAYITVGTGVGVGLIVNGLPTRGFGHCELGHIRPTRLHEDAWTGACPFHGDCVEGLASGPAIKARVGAHRLLNLAPDDPVWATVSWSIAQLCHVIICAASPRAIAIGGGVVANNPHLVGRINSELIESLAGYLELPTDRSVVQLPALGAEAGPLGAIALALRLRR